MEPLLDYYEEVTDDEDYKEDDEVISIQSDSSATDSMLDEDFEVTDPLKFDASLMKISNGLKHDAEGFDELRQMLPSVPVTDLPKPKYGVTRNRLHKVLTGTGRPGGSQYQQTIKKEMKDKPATLLKKEIRATHEIIKEEGAFRREKSKGKVSTLQSENRSTITTKTKPQSFSGLPNPPQVKYPSKSLPPQMLPISCP